MNSVLYTEVWGKVGWNAWCPALRYDTRSDATHSVRAEVWRRFRYNAQCRHWSMTQDQKIERRMSALRYDTRSDGHATSTLRYDARSEDGTHNVRIEVWRNVRWNAQCLHWGMLQGQMGHTTSALRYNARSEDGTHNVHIEVWRNVRWNAQCLHLGMTQSQLGRTMSALRYDAKSVGTHNVFTDAWCNLDGTRNAWSDVREMKG